MNATKPAGRREVTLRRGRLQVLQSRITEGLWFVPFTATVAAWFLAWAIVRFDHGRGSIAQTEWAFSGGAASAQQVLTTIATAVLGFTGLVFSITIVALQFAGSQFSPRVLLPLLRDRGTKIPLGVFVGTFVYTLVVLQSVRVTSDSSQPFVPGDAVTISIGLVLVTVLTFVYFVHHMANSIRVVSIIESVARETRHAIVEAYPEAPESGRVGNGKGEPARRAALEAAGASKTSPALTAPRAGAVTGFDSRALIALACREDVVLELTCAVGDFLPYGAPMVRIHGGTTDASALHIAAGAIGIEVERTMQQDVAFGFRQLVDIAEKALSPALNDPTTAVESLDRIHDLLRRIVVRRIPDGVMHDAAGAVRLVVPTASWPDLVALGFSEILRYGEGSVQVARRMRAALDDLLSAAPPEREAPLRAVLLELDASVARAFEDAASRHLARVPDASGLGSDDEEDD